MEVEPIRDTGCRDADCTSNDVKVIACEGNRRRRERWPCGLWRPAERDVLCNARTICSVSRVGVRQRGIPNDDAPCRCPDIPQVHGRDISKRRDLIVPVRCDGSGPGLEPVVEPRGADEATLMIEDVRQAEHSLEPSALWLEDVLAAIHVPVDVLLRGPPLARRWREI